MNKTKPHFKADHLGILSASLCLIHCTLLPTIFAWKAINFEHEIEGAFKWDYLFLVFSFYAVVQATKNTLFPLIRWVLWSSFGVLVLATLLESYAPIFEYIIIFASLCLAIVHLYNLRYCQRQTCCTPRI